MEVLGYAEAARWVYQQAVEPDVWAPDGLVAITEVRKVHALATERVWGVAQLPDTRESEARATGASMRFDSSRTA